MGWKNRFDFMLAAETSIYSQLEINEIVPRSRSDVPCSAWREKVSQWCYDVVDHLNEDRSIVYVAMNILDQFCATFTSPIDEKTYEIASLSSIFLAVHIAGSGDISLRELVSMSRGGITAEDIIATGSSIANSISLNKPILTPVAFVRSAIQHVPLLGQSVHKQVLLDSASYMIELAVCDNFFSHCKASSIAVAAIMNALETIVCPNSKILEQSLIKATSITVDTYDNIKLLRTRLSCIYNQSVEHLQGFVGPHIIEDDDDGSHDCTNNSTTNMKRDYSVIVSDDEYMPCKRAKADI
jgi:Cyclin, N-terminal domain/Cyclin, C-terminal domain